MIREKSRSIIKIVIFLSLIIFFVCINTSYGEKELLKINIPKDGSIVCQHSMVKGYISDPNLHVFILIHPMTTDKFWVQPILNIHPDRKWKAYCYFGETNQGIGKPFEIIAIASKNKKLYKEGDILPSPIQDNPQIILKSIPIVVIRDSC